MRSSTAYISIEVEFGCLLLVDAREFLQTPGEPRREGAVLCGGSGGGGKNPVDGNGVRGGRQEYCRQKHRRTCLQVGPHFITQHRLFKQDLIQVCSCCYCFLDWAALLGRILSNYLAYAKVYDSTFRHSAHHRVLYLPVRLPWRSVDGRGGRRTNQAFI